MGRWVIKTDHQQGTLVESFPDREQFLKYLLFHLERGETVNVFYRPDPTVEGE